MKNITKITNNYGTMFNQNMQPVDSLAAHKWHKERSLDRAIKVQKTPYAEPTQISKGVTTTTAGGSFALYDTTGGTEIFSYNPDTGVVTINGQLVANVTNTGTYNNISISGNSFLTGTLSQGVIGTTSLIGGSIIGNSITLSSFTGTLGGTVAYPTTGTTAIGSNTFDFQNKNGTPILVYNLGGTNYFWTPTGTM